MDNRVVKKYKSSTLLNLTHPLWLELIFKPKWLSIEDYTRLVSTCSFFYFCESIKEWMRELEESVFLKEPKMRWNRLDNCNKGYDFTYESHTHFMICGMGEEFYIGVYSNKKRLWVALNTKINLDILLNNHVGWTFKGFYIAITLNENGSDFILISNTVKEDFEAILNLYYQIKD